MNANATPDGSIRVYSGLMDSMTDDEMRFAIGHEVGHIANNHAKVQMQKAYLATAARKAAGVDYRLAKFSESFLRDLAENLVNAQFSQSDELEADEYGLKFFKDNGYDQQAAITCLTKLGGTAWFYSSHPSSKRRIKNLQKLLDT